MPPKQKKGNAATTKSGGATVVGGGERQVQKSPAEFFAENQSIAGFDNLGKSLYTSIRELVENSLDACESVNQLPEVQLEIREYTQQQFNSLQGIGGKGSGSPIKKAFERNDPELFRKKGGAKKGSGSKKKKKNGLEEEEDADDDDDDDLDFDERPKKPSAAAGAGKGKKGKKQSSSQEDSYFLLTVRDNGCGMAHDDIPNLLGRVLSGSKYGVRQTRGKFGLGAKMALIWSKKSSGQPIRIKTSHRPTAQQVADGVVPSHYTTCVLDIDIYKNTPRIIEHTRHDNSIEQWTGTEMQVLIGGNWTTYKSRIVQYLQQLAIITPYAVLELRYENVSDPKKNMTVSYHRRSEQMPPPAKQVKHHPSSVNNLVVQQLIQFTRARTLVSFLTKELSSVSPSVAKRLVAELGPSFEEDTDPVDLTNKQITRLVQLLRQVQLFKAPDGSCLSPLGEYNLNLGIQKVLEPDLIATARDKPGAYEGHPFVVEAAVSLGGSNQKEGITVVRFANRIPLLFEGGADVSTRVANTKIRWSSYKIDHKKDKVGVFVSIVSTKIPFKGTSKEYIGDDATEIQLSVKRALQLCCQQLRARLTKRNALKDAKERKSRLAKYVPDVGRSLFGILDAMRKRRAATSAGLAGSSAAIVPTSPSSGAPASSSHEPPAKRRRLLVADEGQVQTVVRALNRGQITEESIRDDLMGAIDEQLEKDDLALLAGEAGAEAGGGKHHRAHKSGLGGRHSMSTDVPVPVYLVPLYNFEDSQYDVRSSLFTFRPIVPISFDESSSSSE